MDFVDLTSSAEFLQKALPWTHEDVLVMLSELTAQESVRPHSRAAIDYASKWVHGGQDYFNVQEHEFKQVFRSLCLPSCAGVLFLAALPGTAVEVLTKSAPDIEWMACGLSADQTAGYTLRPELRGAKQRDGTPRVCCVPQLPQDDMFTKKHLFCFLNTVGQHYTTVVADATVDSNFAFHVDVALARVQDCGAFVWRVDDRALACVGELQRLLQWFDSVHVSTPKQHEDLSIRFIVARNKRAEPRTAVAQQEIVRTVHVLRAWWKAKVAFALYRFKSMTRVFHDMGITSTAAADDHWRKNESVFQITRLTAGEQDSFISAGRQ